MRILGVVFWDGDEEESVRWRIVSASFMRWRWAGYGRVIVPTWDSIRRIDVEGVRAW